MLEKGKVLEGKYRILRELGRGGMSVVYLAEELGTKKTWAVKEVRKDGQNDFQTVRQNLVTEIDTLKSLNHPRLPSIADVIEDDDSFIIVLDFIEGKSLDVVQEESGPQSEEDVIDWAIQLCDVMEYLHTRKPPIIYRDLKPGNIMLKPNGEITIIDFGTAKTYVMDAGGVTTGLGTVGFAAPEQYIGSGMGRSDARTDIFTLGMTMYSLLTNVNPQETLVSDTSVRKVNPQLSHGIDKIIVKCTQRNPEERYQNCSTLKFDLMHIKEISAPFKKSQRVKFSAFVASFALAIGLLASGVILGSAASTQAADYYDKCIEDAILAFDSGEKISLYRQALELPDRAGMSEPYFGLIHAYKDDFVFTQDEANELESLLKNNKAAILENDPDAYIDICFGTGKLFWYFYDDPEDSTIGAKKSIMWFNEVLDNYDSDYDPTNLKLTRLYYDLGVFYRDISTSISEESDKGKYASMLNNFNELVEIVGADENESEVIRLQLLGMAERAIHDYAPKLKFDNVPRENVDTLYARIQNILVAINVPEENDDIRTIKKNEISARIAETGKAIEKAYNPNKENDK